MVFRQGRNIWAPLDKSCLDVGAFLTGWWWMGGLSWKSIRHSIFVLNRDDSHAIIVQQAFELMDQNPFLIRSTKNWWRQKIFIGLWDCLLFDMMQNRQRLVVPIHDSLVTFERSLLSMECWFYYWHSRESWKPFFFILKNWKIPIGEI